ncbi:DUF1433 domain-containing protein [Listeria rocourtiae]|uniref:DUF1433 domain-containing protein n=1 Tax=Listeria rocourtiae TaxID=647910 RepID=UPI00162913C1|nr:DUF1433 domain-containing protein [Listeria rocourtiae]MBC1604443.1 DUF1433 domain-containing protein [Listeria rocourtiae]
MEMKTKIILTSIGVLLLLSITGGVLFVKHEIDKRETVEKDRNSQLIAEEGPRIEKYLKYNYKDIHSVTITGVDNSPTGIPHILGYVNDNKKLSFNAGIYDEHFETALNPSGDSFPHTKLPDHETLTVSEIEKLEKAQ